MEQLYSMYDDRMRSPTETMLEVAAAMRDTCGPLPLEGIQSITFVTDLLPYGFAFPDYPTSHLFDYPDLGIATINGLVANQRSATGVQVAVTVDPATTPAPEIDRVEEALSRRRVFVRGYSGVGATVRAVQQMVELFPYDLILFATHCGDSGGWRRTYEFDDSKGLRRTLVVDVAASFAPVEGDKVLVIQQDRFVSLDGVAWDDPNKSDKINVGTAIRDFVNLTTGGNDLRPSHVETVKRIPGNRALQLHDGQYIPLPRQIASYKTPIVINNACVSWDELSGNFMFGGARCYIGTVCNITTTEAGDVVTRAIERHYEKPIAEAFWHAQREAYDVEHRRPYIVTGVFPQTFGPPKGDVINRIKAQLVEAHSHWAERLANVHSSDRRLQDMQDIVEYYRRELAHFERNWSSQKFKP